MHDERLKQQLGRREFLRNVAAGAAFGGLGLPRDSADVLMRWLHPRVANGYALTGQGRPFEMLVLGDSIMWGQGLKEEQKFSSKVADWLKANLPGVEIHRHIFAHSGARIAPNPAQDAKPPTHGEVPNHFPSITAQLAAAPTATFPLHPPLDPASVSLVLLDGGINDFGTKVILNLDFTKGRAWVREQTRTVCVDRMRALLPKVVTAFPNAKIVVTNYFQIVSEQTEMVLVWELLRAWNVVGTAVGEVSEPIRRKLSDQSLAFHEVSTAGFREVVRDAARIRVAGTKPIPVRANPSVDLTRQPALSRVALAEVPFGPQHSYGARETLLFYVNEPDPAASVRKPMCEQQVPNASLELPNCLLAAAGHPNIAGATVYANTIISTARQWLPEWQAAFNITPPKSTPAHQDPVGAPRPRPRP
jgi:hypothetical protein